MFAPGSRKKSWVFLKCENINIYSCLQSERWGGKYECLCPAGLAFINTTIAKGEEEKLGISAGPFIMTEFSEVAEDLKGIFGEKITQELFKRSEKDSRARMLQGFELCRCIVHAFLLYGGAQQH